MDALGKGFSASELLWETSERQWMPKALKWRDPRWFDFDPTGQRLRLRDADGHMELAAYKFVVHRAQAKSGLTMRGGLARCAAWSWLFKNLTVKDWARFIDAYGQPIRLGFYGPAASDEDLDILHTAVGNVAADAAALLPEGMRIEFVEDRSVRARSEIYLEFLRYIDERLSIAVLGQTLTTESGGTGSYALGTVHNLVRHDIEASDAAQLAETLERDVAVPIVALNNGRRREYPRIRIERAAVHDGKQVADVLSALVPLGLRVRESDVRERLGYEAPAAGDMVLAAPSAAAAAARLRLATANTATDDDPLAQVIDAIDGGTWQRLAAPLIEPVLRRARRTRTGCWTKSPQRTRRWTRRP